MVTLNCFRVSYNVYGYGWRNALLILSAIVLNCTIFGALFRPLEPVKKNKKRIYTKHSTDLELQPLKKDLKHNNGSSVHPSGQETDEDKSEDLLSRSHSVGFDTRKGLNKLVC